MEGLNPHQAALKYILRDPHVAATVPGVTTIEQIEECATVMGASLSQGDLRELKAYQAFLENRICTLCGGCTGECPSGVPYGDLLRAVMYHDGYRNNLLARETVKGVLSQQILQRCSGCSLCTAVCRRGLQVKEQIQLALNLCRHDV
jgi:predicted aldo/keto reductase-like oxidoreductase